MAEKIKAVWSWMLDAPSVETLRVLWFAALIGFCKGATISHTHLRRICRWAPDIRENLCQCIG